MKTAWISVLIQQMEPTPQPRERAIPVASKPNDDGMEETPRFDTQAEAINWWVEHKSKFTAPDNKDIVRGAPQVIIGAIDDEDVIGHLDDIIDQRVHVRPKDGFTLTIRDDGTPNWT